jgi:hypothetical protein
MARLRVSTAPLLRVLGLAVLLFGVLVTHAVSVESGRTHTATSTAALAVAVSAEDDGTAVGHLPARLTAPEDRHGDHGASHPGEQCVSAQPHLGPVLTPPCCAASVGEPVVSGPVAVAQGFDGRTVSLPHSAAVRSSVVRQV